MQRGQAHEQPLSDGKRFLGRERAAVPPPLPGRADLILRKQVVLPPANFHKPSGLKT